ncbi:hypothetical protein B0O99DRAFT_597637 [Bisporella sp. PMI_857]|nr:hypothetical protein B0O99DRAFT_597637 [Bisporella sp. PMI_857]
MQFTSLVLAFMAVATPLISAAPITNATSFDNETSAIYGTSLASMALSPKGPQPTWKDLYIGELYPNDNSYGDRHDNKGPWKIIAWTDKTWWKYVCDEHYVIRDGININDPLGTARFCSDKAAKDCHYKYGHAPFMHGKYLRKYWHGRWWTLAQEWAQFEQKNEDFMCFGGWWVRPKKMFRLGEMYCPDGYCG